MTVAISTRYYITIWENPINILISPYACSELMTDYCVSDVSGGSYLRTFDTVMFVHAVCIVLYMYVDTMGSIVNYVYM